MLNRIVVALTLTLISIDVVSAETGFGDVLQHEAILPVARKSPGKYLQRFTEGEPDNRKRTILFMVLASLGKERRISSEQFLTVVDTGLSDLHAPIRNHAVHSIELVFEKEHAIRWLHRVTLDKSPSVRYQGVEALARYPSAHSLPYVDALLGDPSITVRDRAASTLNMWFQQAQCQPALDVLRSAAKSQNLLRSGTATSQLATNHGIVPDVQLMNRYVEHVIAQNPPYAHSDNVRHAMKVLMKVMDQSSMRVFVAGTKHSHPGIAGDAQEAIHALENVRSVEIPAGPR